MSKPRTGTPKRVAVGLLAGALAVFGVALAPPAGATANVTNERVAGATRYGTAAAIAAHSSLGTPVHAIVATGENYPDALAAAALAGANAPAPIILTESNTYTAEAKAGLAALKGKGVTAITIVGGTVAVSETVEDAIEADGFTVTRVAGDDRYETAAAIATAANTKSPAANIGGLKTALIATGQNFPDALAGGSAAYGNRLPILLVNDTVPAATADAIASLGIKKAVVLGGTAAVSTTVEGQLAVLTGNTVQRLAGQNRFGTAAAVGDYVQGTLGYALSNIVLATGTNFPDALAAGPLAGANRAAIVLTASLPTESRDFLDKHSARITKLLVAGGTEAIDDATVAAAEAAAETVGNDAGNVAVTTRPELTGASIVETITANQVTTAKPIGTYVRFTFDEALNTSIAPDFAKFHVYASNGTTVYDGASATIESTATPANSTVLVRFAGADTAALAGALTTATVDFEAVRDASSAGNPEGDAPIGSPGTTTTASGTTSAPDLVSISRFGSSTSNANQTPVDFTFDQATTVSTATGFHLIDTLNRVHNCTADDAATGTNAGGGTIKGGNGTTVITALCDNAADGNGAGGTANTTLLTSGAIARGYVDAGAVRAGAGLGTTVNVLQAADVAATSTGPDLVSVAASTSTATADANKVIFTFDQAVTNASAAAFTIYNASGQTISTGQGTAEISSTDATRVSVTFTSRTGMVGGTVSGDANVFGTGNVVCSAPSSCNVADEVGAGASSTSQTPGSTSLADLTSVALAAQTDVFGSATGFQATYTFDAAVGTTVTANKFFLYASDGTRFQATTCTAPTTATSTVVCTAFRNALTLVATTTQQNAAVLGTVDNAAVANNNVEGAAATTGGTGTPAS